MEKEPFIEHLHTRSNCHVRSKKDKIKIDNEKLLIRKYESLAKTSSVTFERSTPLCIISK